MGNRIRRISVWDQRLDPAETEVVIAVVPEVLTSSTQVHGRLAGPRCRYSSTVEVAYPLRECSRQYEKEGEPHVIVRAVIPEPSFWEPETPFLYGGSVELWQKGERNDEAPITHGLRTFNLGPHGLRWNGRLLTLRGVVREQLGEEQAFELHRSGCNTLLTPVTAATASVWATADQFGFLMLGRIADREGMARSSSLRDHPCCLGWVIDSGLLQDELVLAALPEYLSSGGLAGGRIIGVEMIVSSSLMLPPWPHFVVCEERLLPSVTEIGLPKVVLRKARFPQTGPRASATGSASVLGWLYS